MNKIKKVALTIFVVSNVTTVVVVALVRPTHDTIHDGRYASCSAVTDDGVTDHLAAFAKRCH